MLEQPRYAAGQLIDDLFLALQHGRHVDFGALDRDAVHRQVIPCLGKLVTAVQQRLGGDAADIEAGATQADLALVIQPLLDTGHGQTQLGCPDRRHIARRSGAYYHYIVFFRHALVPRKFISRRARGYNCSRIRAGSSIRSLMATRNCTAVLPSINR